MRNLILASTAVAALLLPVIASAQTVLGFGSIASTAGQSTANSGSFSALAGVTAGSAHGDASGAAVATATPVFGFAAQGNQSNANTTSASLGFAASGAVAGGAAGSAALAFGGFGIVVP